MPPRCLKTGDYVLATKYSDGDPRDQFCVGIYDRPFEAAGDIRHLVVDWKGDQFRANGFRRVAHVGRRRGTWIIEHLELIEEHTDRFSVWHWHRAPWRELTAAEGIKIPARATKGASA